MAVKTLPRYLMTASEITVAGERLVRLCSDLPEENAMITVVVKEMEKDIDAVKDAYGAESDPGLSAKVREADEARDEAMVQMAGLLRGLQFHFDPEIADAAARIYKIIERHDFGSKRSSFENQSMVVTAMLKDLETPAALRDIELCGIMPAITELTEKQQAFKNTIMERIDASSDTDEPALRELVDPIRTAIGEILVFVESCERLRPDIWSGFVTDLNGLVTEFSSKARSRKSRKEAFDEPLPVAS